MAVEAKEMMRVWECVIKRLRRLRLFEQVVAQVLAM